MVASAKRRKSRLDRTASGASPDGTRVLRSSKRVRERGLVKGGEEKDEKEVKARTSKQRKKSLVLGVTAKAPSKQRVKMASYIGNGEEEKEETASPIPPFVKTLSISSLFLKCPITAHLYQPLASTDFANPLLIFTHGASGTISTPAVANFCHGWTSARLRVLAFKGSTNLGARVKGFCACIEHESVNAAAGLKGNVEDEEEEHVRLILGGRSMGARAAVMAALDSSPSSTSFTDEKNPLDKTAPNAGRRRQRIVSLILASYPLVGPNASLRDRILIDLPASSSVLFIVGSADAMCPLEVLEATRARMKARSSVIVVRGADHGMHLKGKEREERGERMVKETGRMAAEWVVMNRVEKESEEVVWIRDD